MAVSELATASGPTVASGSRVVLIVSNGPSPGPRAAAVTMPAVIGRQQGDALQQLQDAGLNTQVFTDFNESIRRGHVADQFPLAGAGVAIASEVAILVSSGPAEKTAPVSLPDVVGLPEAEAVATLSASGFVPEVAHDYHRNVAAGMVIAQLPSQATASAEAVPQRSLLWLWITLAALAALAVVAVVSFSLLGSKQVSVPDVTGQTQAQAQQTIVSAGLGLGQVTFQAGSDAAEGTVISQQPPAGAKTRSGQKIALVVAATTPKVTVPNFVGLSGSDASRRVSSAGLVAQTESAYSNAVPRDTVISQSPAAGTQVASGTTVTLTLSLGPQSTYATLPNLIGMSQADAVDKVASLGMTSHITNVFSSTTSFGRVDDQVPAAGQSVIVGNTVGLAISQGPAPSNAVTIPDLHGQSTSSASAAIAALNLNSTVIQWDGTGQPANTVVSQSPSAGEQVAANGSVAVFVSSGK